MSTPAANEPANEDGVESDEEQNAISSVITEFAAARHTVIACGRLSIAGATANSRDRVGRSPRADVDRESRVTRSKI